MIEQPKIVELEVVNEPPRASERAVAAPSHKPNAAASGGPPIHPLAALLLVLVDNLWLVPEFIVIDWAITIPLCFITVFFPTLFIQKFIKRQRVGPALGFALLLAVIAAVPTSLLGTPVGAAMLAWFGISKLWSGSRDKPMP